MRRITSALAHLLAPSWLVPLLVPCFVAGLLAGELPPVAEQDPATDTVQMIEDRDHLVTQLNIDIADGNVAIADIFRAVSRASGYDDSEIRDAIPQGTVSLNSKPVRWAMSAVNHVLDPCVHCDVHRDGTSLQITVDRESARNWINDRKQSVRSVWSRLDWREDFPEYGIELLGEVEDVASHDIVVLVHGLNSRPEDLVTLIPVVSSGELIPATFRYPNDQPIDASAKLLASELQKLKAAYPESKVRLVTHSMGGLVARYAVETDLDPGNVSQLIMLAPPNHGSSLASVATFMDCYEFFSCSDLRRMSVLVESVSDGLGEATADLAPRSVFLDKLNNHHRNANIRYTILLGTNGPMQAEEMLQLRDQVREYTDGNRFTRFASSKLNVALDNLNEVVEGQGDGAVSCERGKLEGVPDIVELPFTHAGILSPGRDSSQAAYKIIRNRLSNRSTLNR